MATTAGGMPLVPQAGENGAVLKAQAQKDWLRHAAPEHRLVRMTTAGRAPSPSRCWLLPPTDPQRGEVARPRTRPGHRWPAAGRRRHGGAGWQTARQPTCGSSAGSSGAHEGRACRSWRARNAPSPARSAPFFFSFCLAARRMYAGTYLLPTGWCFGWSYCQMCAWVVPPENSAGTSRSSTVPRHAGVVASRARNRAVPCPTASGSRRWRHVRYRRSRLCRTRCGASRARCRRPRRCQWVQCCSCWRCRDLGAGGAKAARPSQGRRRRQSCRGG